MKYNRDVDCDKLQTCSNLFNLGKMQKFHEGLYSSAMTPCSPIEARLFRENRHWRY
jgi:hypothetical protein